MNKQLIRMQSIGAIAASFLFACSAFFQVGCPNPQVPDVKVTPDGGSPPPPADGGNTTPCIGVKPPYPAVSPTPPPDIQAPNPIPPGEVCKYKPGQCIGSEVPNWKLTDVQPQSCGYQQAYNLKAFKGHVTVVVLLAGW